MEKLQEWLADRNDEALLADGFDAAFVGVVSRGGLSCPVAVYDAERCVEILIERDGMTYEEADEFFSFNVLGSYVGEYTPMYLTRYELRRG
jgi:hypothetical protein|tara:strand:- start:11912 stop:12184 length:273 start_codon:yes stop_codon:yes gene_type:complete